MAARKPSAGRFADTGRRKPPAPPVCEWYRDPWDFKTMVYREAGPRGNVVIVKQIGEREWQITLHRGGSIFRQVEPFKGTYAAALDYAQWFASSAVRLVEGAWREL